jgi:hypothetical protein
MDCVIESNGIKDFAIEKEELEAELEAGGSAAARGPPSMGLR